MKITKTEDNRYIVEVSKEELENLRDQVEKDIEYFDCDDEFCTDMKNFVKSVNEVLD